MTGLRSWRRVAKSLILFFFAWEVAVAIVGLVLVVLVAVQGGGTPSPERLIAVVGTLGIYGVVIWVICDARRRRRPHPAKHVATAGDEV